MKLIIAGLLLAIGLSGCVTDSDGLSGEAWMELHHPGYLQHQADMEAQQRAIENAQMQQEEFNTQLGNLNDSIMQLNTQITTFNENN